ncbi:MAG: cell division protein ZapA [Lachnospiraceae bacterium]|nr:cell division protein ZapA [Lachnospiraceae bacterium]
MSQKANTVVIIGGKQYTLSGYEEEEYLQKVASYINNKLSEVNGLDSIRRLSSDMRSILLSINIADDYFKALSRVDKLESDVSAKEQELYDIKHELISLQVKLEEMEKQKADTANRLKELEFEKKNLEKAYEDKLLGPIDSSNN